MADVHILVLKSHLEALDTGIRAVVREYKANSIAISDPSVPHPPAHMSAFSHCPVTSEAFTEVRVELGFFSPSLSCAKRDWMQG